MNSAASEDVSSAEHLHEIFARFRPCVASRPLVDFSRLHHGVRVYCEVSPTSVEEVSALVALAAEKGVTLRTRGNGHALNGSSLPQSGELVVHTRELTDVRHGTDGTVAAGAGAVIWSVGEWLKIRGYSLPVLNDGFAGPTVGGYVSAGGFGPGSRIWGGFWNNVAELTVVDGRGRIQCLSRTDALFPWLFGAMGQLGIVVETKLDVVARQNAAPLLGGERLAPVGRDAPDRRAEDEAGRLFWFTFFVRESSVPEAMAQLDALELAHTTTFAFRNRYDYFIPHRCIIAPLVWPHAVDCHAVGAWGILKDTTPGGIEKVRVFDAQFTEMALENGYRRYVQSEVPFGPELYARCFGPDVYAAFRLKKEEQDPHHLFNRHWVFV